MICLQEDDFTNELQTDRGQAVWVATLTNGQVATLDDGRPGEMPQSAWLRLRKYCQDNDLGVSQIYIKFRTNRTEDLLPEGTEACFFCKSALGNFSYSFTLAFMLVGYILGGKLVVQRWQVPELILANVEEREVDPSSECLIWSPHVRSQQVAITPTGH